MLFEEPEVTDPATINVCCPNKMYDSEGFSLDANCSFDLYHHALFFFSVEMDQPRCGRIGTISSGGKGIQVGSSQKHNSRTYVT